VARGFGCGTWAAARAAPTQHASARPCAFVQARRLPGVVDRQVARDRWQAIARRGRTPTLSSCGHARTDTITNKGALWGRAVTMPTSRSLSRAVILLSASGPSMRCQCLSGRCQCLSDNHPLVLSLWSVVRPCRRPQMHRLRWSASVHARARFVLPISLLSLERSMLASFFVRGSTHSSHLSRPSLSLPLSNGTIQHCKSSLVRRFAHRHPAAPLLKGRWRRVRRSPDDHDGRSCARPAAVRDWPEIALHQRAGSRSR
jgi:hypothetical protein